MCSRFRVILTIFVLYGFTFPSFRQPHLRVNDSILRIYARLKTRAYAHSRASSNIHVIFTATPYKGTFLPPLSFFSSSSLSFLPSFLLRRRRHRGKIARDCYYKNRMNIWYVTEGRWSASRARFLDDEKFNREWLASRPISYDRVTERVQKRTRCVIPTRVHDRGHACTRAPARESQVSLLGREGKGGHSSSRRGVRALSFGRNPSTSRLNMCTAFCALPYLLVNDLPSGTPRSFLSVTCAAKKGEQRLLTVNIIKKKSSSRATGKLLYYR